MLIWAGYVVQYLATLLPFYMHLLPLLTQVQRDGPAQHVGPPTCARMRGPAASRRIANVTCGLSRTSSCGTGCPTLCWQAKTTSCFAWPPEGGGEAR